jgi:hypothetical protein
MSQGIRAIGIAWYKPEHYDELKRLFSDGRNLPSTYNEWLKQAEGLLNKLKREGQTVEKVYIEPDTFPAWCAEKGMDVDSKARVRFADEFVAKKYINRKQ